MVKRPGVEICQLTSDLRIVGHPDTADVIVGNGSYFSGTSRPVSENGEQKQETVNGQSSQNFPLPFHQIGS